MDDEPLTGRLAARLTKPSNAWSRHSSTDRLPIASEIREDSRRRCAISASASRRSFSFFSCQSASCSAMRAIGPRAPPAPAAAAAGSTGIEKRVNIFFLRFPTEVSPMPSSSDDMPVVGRPGETPLPGDFPGLLPYGLLRLAARLSRSADFIAPPPVASTSREGSLTVG